MAPAAGSGPGARFPRVRGSHFVYSLPPGWSVGEEGAFALVLRSQDLMAGIVVIGQSGLMQGMSPEQFAYYEMQTVMRLAPDVRLSGGRAIPPMPGYTQAAVFEVTYTLATPMGMVPLRGMVVSNVAVGYAQCNGTITLAAAEVRQWPSYANWLPGVALAAQNVGADAFGSQTMGGVISGIAQQDHAANRAYQEWSQNTWQQVTHERNASVDRQQGAMGPMLTGQEWISEGFGGQDIRRSTTPACIWRSRDGREISSPDPSFDPRTASDVDWVRVR